MRPTDLPMKDKQRVGKSCRRKYSTVLSKFIVKKAFTLTYVPGSYR